MLVNSLNDLNFHDSSLLSITIDKKNKRIDRLILELDYIENYDTMECQKRKLVFYNCLNLKLNLNFGFFESNDLDSINIGYEIEHSKKLDELKLEFKDFINLNKIKHFYIETNSSSTFNIFADSVELI